MDAKRYPNVPLDVQRHAEGRARYLAEAYDVDDGTKDAFVWDVSNEICTILDAFLGAIENVLPTRELIGNRKVRRAAIAGIKSKIQKK